MVALFLLMGYLCCLANHVKSLLYHVHFETRTQTLPTLVILFNNLVCSGPEL